MSAEGSRYNRDGYTLDAAEYRQWFSGETVGLNAGSGSGIQAYLMNADQLYFARSLTVQSIAAGGCQAL